MDWKQTESERIAREGQTPQPSKEIKVIHLQFLGFGGIFLSITSVCAADLVPEGECGRIIGGKLLVMIVMEGSTAIEGEELKRIQIGKVITAVNFSGLEHSDEQPGPEEEEMVEEEDHGNEESNAEHESLNGMGKLSGESKRNIILVVKLVPDAVDSLVVKGSVSPIVPAVLHQKSAEEFGEQIPNRWHGFIVVRQVNMNRLEHIIHQNGERKIDRNLGPSDFLNANPLFSKGIPLVGLNFKVSHKGKKLKNERWNRKTKIKGYLNQKTAQSNDLKGGITLAHGAIIELKEGLRV